MMTWRFKKAIDFSHLIHRFNVLEKSFLQGKLVITELYNSISTSLNSVAQSKVILEKQN